MQLTDEGMQRKFDRKDRGEFGHGETAAAGVGQAPAYITCQHMDVASLAGSSHDCSFVAERCPRVIARNVAITADVKCIALQLLPRDPAHCPNLSANRDYSALICPVTILHGSDQSRVARRVQRSAAVSPVAGYLPAEAL